MDGCHLEGRLQFPLRSDYTSKPSKINSSFMTEQQDQGDRLRAAAPPAPHRHRLDVRGGGAVRLPRHHGEISQYPDGRHADRLGALHQRLRADADRLQSADAYRPAAHRAARSCRSCGRCCWSLRPCCNFLALRWLQLDEVAVDHFHLSVHRRHRLRAAAGRMDRLAALVGDLRRLWRRAADHAARLRRHASGRACSRWRRPSATASMR